MSMRPEDKDYFTLVQDILEAVRTGNYVHDIASDCPGKDKSAFLVTSEAFSTEDRRYECVTKLISTLFMQQLPDHVRDSIHARNDAFDQDPETAADMMENGDFDYHFATTRYNGGSCFFFRIPDVSALNFEKARESLDTIRNMFVPSVVKNLPQESDIVSIKVTYEQEHYFNGVIQQIMAFHKLREIDPIHEQQTHDGFQIFFKRDEYARFIRNRDILGTLPPTVYGLNNAPEAKI